jgi:hypothetical protein
MIFNAQALMVSGYSLENRAMQQELAIALQLLTTTDEGN